MNKKRVAIITWTKWNNYGTILQSFALYTIITNLGYETKVLNDKKISSTYCMLQYGTPTFLQSLKHRVKVFISSLKKDQIDKIIDKREFLCKNFKSKYIKYHSKNVCYNKLDHLEKYFDIFVCGSDQIWSPNEIYFDPYYFLNFVKNSDKIAYAPSLGMSYIPDDKKNIFSGMLQSFKKISVREETAKEILCNITKKNIEVCIDPTLLLSANEWISKLNLNNNLDKNYVLCYYLGESEWYRNKVNMICKTKNLKKIVIPWLRKDITNINLSEIIIPDPRDFLNLILNASYIFTDSFHGLLFSLIFRKNVYVFARFSDNDENSQNSRVKDICSKLKIDNRYIKENDNIEIDENIDYQYIDSIIAKLRQESLEYLSSSL